MKWVEPESHPAPGPSQKAHGPLRDKVLGSRQERQRYAGEDGAAALVSCGSGVHGAVKSAYNQTVSDGRLRDIRMFSDERSLQELWNEITGLHEATLP